MAAFGSDSDASRSHVAAGRGEGCARAIPGVKSNIKIGIFTIEALDIIILAIVNVLTSGAMRTHK
jgi:hypothetical protein